MTNIEKLKNVLNTENFIEAATETYRLMAADMETVPLSLNEYITYLKALFINEFIQSKNDFEKKCIMQAAISGDINIVDVISVFQMVEATQAKLGELREKNYIKNAFNYAEYEDDPLYEEMSKYNNFIASVIKQKHRYHTIKEIKMGEYEVPLGYRLSQKEIRTIENVKLTAPLNRVIHLLYDVEGPLIQYCDYSSIPDDDIIKQFAFHTEKVNPVFEIIFEDGTIVEYLCGDIRVKPYNIQQLLSYTKLCMVKYYKHNDVYELGTISKKQFTEDVICAFLLARTNLNMLDEVYTKSIIEDSKKELESIKQLVKKYNL